jgi:hypothetical protein
VDDGGEGAALAGSPHLYDFFKEVHGLVCNLRYAALERVSMLGVIITLTLAIE